jgi:hypothetical protein
MVAEVVRYTWRHHRRQHRWARLSMQAEPAPKGIPPWAQPRHRLGAGAKHRCLDGAVVTGLGISAGIR